MSILDVPFTSRRRSTDSLQFLPRTIADRDYWDALRRSPAAASVMARARLLPDRPSMPVATDFLAARRRNDREPLDRHWRETRANLSLLCMNRCLLGIDPNDPDDRLLNWIFAFVTEPTWTVSAHLPGQDLPTAGRHTLDLAACEMAAQMAETREVLEPWLDRYSGTLADSIIHEIDRRVLTPLIQGPRQGWEAEDREDGTLLRTNNWSGVCGGSILIACESLGAQGRYRLEARASAMRALRRFVEAGFTEHGECDEGIRYWRYGMEFAVMGWSRLSDAELTAHLNLHRLRQITDYPRRAHLFDDLFFSGNDSGLHCSAGMHFVPWLARVTRSPWLADWSRRSSRPDGWHFSQLLRAFDALDTIEPPSQPVGQVPPQASFLPDQQVAILRTHTSSGEIVAALTGGSNDERHNHNDLGHFIVAIDRQIVIPDLGVPTYTADFFNDPNRYNYLTASSRGHCCPMINGHPQRAGAQAAGKVLAWEPDADQPTLLLDLTSAYPPEAGLRLWTRQLRIESGQILLTDHFVTARPDAAITHVAWTACEPRAEENRKGFTIADLKMRLDVTPRASRIIRVDAHTLGLRESIVRLLYRIELDYRTDSGGSLHLNTLFGLPK